eukprot:311776-Pleurochrysis_carterae.AAC.1
MMRGTLHILQSQHGLTDHDNYHELCRCARAASRQHCRTRDLAQRALSALAIAVYRRLGMTIVLGPPLN